MPNLDIYCFSMKYFNLLDKLPSCIKPFGLGNNNYPEHWLTEKKGENILNLNKYYGEYTGVYWVWKNQLKNMDENDWIGTCHYRRLWLNNLYKEKQKFSINSLYDNLLKSDNNIFLEYEAIQVQPILLKHESVLQQFNKVHKGNILEECINFLELDEREKFRKYLNGNELCITIFITKARLFKKFCESLFPWLEKCLDYCMKNNLCKDYNIRLPAFLMERYSSYWFSVNTKIQN